MRNIVFFVVYFIVGFLKHKNSLNRILENEVSFLEITDDGFWFGYKGKIKNFIDYNLIDKVYYKSRFFEAGLQEGLKVSTRSYGLFRFFGTTFHPYIGIEFKDDNGFKQKIRLYFHIHNLYKAVDIIIAKISKDKLENIRFDNSGEMSLILGNKSIIPGVNLDKLSGKIILIILTILVLGFWIFMVLFLVD